MGLRPGRALLATIGLVLCTGLLSSPAGATVASPVVIPADVSGGAPQSGATIDWPPYAFGPDSIAVIRGTFANFLGNLADNGLVWDDVGSGLPTYSGSGPWGFPDAGVYAYHCSCGGFINGTVYAVGPRALVTPTALSPDNSGPVTYSLDASKSFVTDFVPHTIKSYAFDFNGDGVFDQTGPDPTGQATFDPGGSYAVNVRVTDDADRTGDATLVITVPKALPPAPAVPPIVDDGSAGSSGTGVVFPTVKITVKAAKRIKLALLRRNGLTVRVGGVSPGDTVRATISKGKTTFGSGTRRAASTSTDVRIRVSRWGRNLLGATRRVKSLRITATVTGSDGFTATKARSIRLTH